MRRPVSFSESEEFVSNPGWMIDELLHAGEEHLDADYVAGYDRKLAHDHSEDLEILREHGLKASSTIVDLGAGTGSFVEAVAPHCDRVIAVDVSPAMLSALRRRMESTGTANVEMVHAGFLSYEHQGEPADIVYSRNALHHLPDFWKALALQRIATMIRPGGVFLLHDLVYSFEPEEANAVFESWLSNAAARPEDGWTRLELETHIRTEHSTFSWLLEAMLERAGFEVRDVIHRPVRTYSRYLCIRR